MENVTMDGEWIQLIRQAKELGLTKEEVLNFLGQKEIENKKDEPTYHVI